jgi:hypothetical protein
MPGTAAITGSTEQDMGRDLLLPRIGSGWNEPIIVKLQFWDHLTPCRRAMEEYRAGRYSL